MCTGRICSTALTGAFRITETCWMARVRGKYARELAEHNFLCRLAADSYSEFANWIKERDQVIKGMIFSAQRGSRGALW